MPVPEPHGLDPGAGGRLGASDADREQVATVLNTAYAEGRLSREEHEERLGLVLRAHTFADLVPLTHDLLPTATGIAAQHDEVPYRVDRHEAPNAVAPDSNSTNEPETLLAVFGGVQRAGRWRLRRRTRAVAVFGGIDLDLREATFDGDAVEISGFWCFGGLDLRVPAGVEVRDRTAGIFGGTDIKHVGAHRSGAPTLIIKGVSLFGGVTVRGSERAIGDTP